MKITVINGTQVKGCTYHIKEAFLDVLRQGNTLREFTLPRDMPHFCTGCKTCFFQSEIRCPHAQYVQPIWEAMLEADLLILTSPVYALRTSGQMKALLDHLCVHWMVHRPQEQMFTKRAVILTNAIGVFNGGAQKDMATSLSWLGVSHIKKLGVGLMEGVIWQELSARRRDKIVRRAQRLAVGYRSFRPARMGLVVQCKFAITRLMHQTIAKNERPLSADNRHWLEKGWIKVPQSHK